LALNNQAISSYQVLENWTFLGTESLFTASLVRCSIYRSVFHPISSSFSLSAIEKTIRFPHQSWHVQYSLSCRKLQSPHMFYITPANFNSLQCHKPNNCPKPLAWALPWYDVCKELVTSDVHLLPANHPTISKDSKFGNAGTPTLPKSPTSAGRRLSVPPPRPNAVLHQASKTFSPGFSPPRTPHFLSDAKS
jgi:hypothetical protein